MTVLTSRTSGEGAIEGAAEVVRTGDALASRLNWRRRHFDALSGGDQSGYSPPSRLEAVVVPDLAVVTWLPFVLPRALSLARKEQFDVLLTSSPPQSAHLVGLAPPGAACPGSPSPGRLDVRASAGALAVEGSAQARCFARDAAWRANAMIGVTEPIVADLKERLGANAVLITNGFDPEEVPPGDGVTSFLDPDRHSLVHTGRMEAARSSPAPLLAALRKLSESPEVANRLEVVLPAAVRTRARPPRRGRPRRHRQGGRLAGAAACACASASR